MNVLIFWSENFFPFLGFIASEKKPLKTVWQILSNIENYFSQHPSVHSEFQQEFLKQRGKECALQTSTQGVSMALYAMLRESDEVHVEAGIVRNLRFYVNEHYIQSYCCFFSLTNLAIATRLQAVTSYPTWNLKQISIGDKAQ